MLRLFLLACACAAGRRRRGPPPLPRYSLLLPAGARYHALAGPSQRTASAVVWGLRPFQLPFNTILGMGVEYGTRWE